MSKKRVLIIIGIILLVIMIFWINGVIPKFIAKKYGNNYMNKHFPEMKLEFVSIEYSKYHGDYIISFKDKNNNTYGCTIGPKLLPINLGQGLFAIEELYRENY